MRLHLAGYLNYFDLQKRSWIDLELAEKAALSSILKELGVPMQEIVLCVVNGEMVTLETTFVSSQDVVELIPSIGGGD